MRRTAVDGGRAERRAAGQPCLLIPVKLPPDLFASTNRPDEVSRLIHVLEAPDVWTLPITVP